MTLPYVPGYAAVLVRTETKARLRSLRDRLGLRPDSLVERCLATALLDLALNSPSSDQELMERFHTAAEEDLRVSAPPSAGSTSRPQPSPLTGTVDRGARD